MVLFLFAVVVCCGAQILFVTVDTWLPQRPSHGRGLFIGEHALCLLWSSLTLVGLRRLVPILRFMFPQFVDTVFCFPVEEYPGAVGLVALTIDDGICRQNSSHSMLDEVLALLDNYSAHATFFLCSNYTNTSDLPRLVQAGHELANHLPSDGEYTSMDAAHFESVLLETHAMLAPYLAAGSPRWFRAPSGKLTKPMAGVLKSRNMTHALGDSFADDGAIPDPNRVSALYLRQAVSGSVTIFHMPEHGFREHTLEVMRLFLGGLKAQGLLAVTLGHLQRSAKGKWAGGGMILPVL